MKEVKEKYLKEIYLNILKAIIIVLYFFVLNLAYKNISTEHIELGIKIFTMIFLFMAIYIFERAYKKDDDNLAIQGIEILVLSAYTLTSRHITNKFNFEFRTYSLVASYIFAIYFILKCIVIYTKGRKEEAENLSDIKEIVKKDEPVKKEATKKSKEDVKKDTTKTSKETSTKVSIRTKSEASAKTENKKSTSKKSTTAKKKTTQKAETKANTETEKEKQDALAKKKTTTKKAETKANTETEKEKKNAQTKKKTTTKKATTKTNTENKKEEQTEKSKPSKRKATTKNSTKKEIEEAPKTEKPKRKQVKKEVKEND